MKSPHIMALLPQCTGYPLCPFSFLSFLFILLCFVNIFDKVWCGWRCFGKRPIRVFVFWRLVNEMSLSLLLFSVVGYQIISKIAADTDVREVRPDLSPLSCMWETSRLHPRDCLHLCIWAFHFKHCLDHKHFLSQTDLISVVNSPQITDIMCSGGL